VDEPVAAPPAPTVGPPPGERPDNTGRTQRIVGIVVAGAGVVGVAVGATFGVQAISKNDEADTFCRKDKPTLCTQRGVDLAGQADTAATLSTIGFGAGAGLVAVGALLYFLAPSGHRSAGAPRTGVHAAPWIGDAKGLAVGGSF